MVRSALKGRAFVFVALFYVQFLMLLRSVIVARLLGPEQFGIAVTFVLVQQFIDMSTDTGLNKYLLQSREGNRSAVQRTVQAVAATRGLFAAGLIVVLGYPILSALGFTSSMFPFFILAASAIALGLVHYDNARLQRLELFTNDSLSNIIGETCALTVALVSLAFVRDYTVMLYALLARSVGMALASHLLSKRRYALRYDRAAAGPMWIYIRPLLVNGPLLFVAAQADRLLVSTVLGPLELGIYSATLLLVSTPSSLLTRFLGVTFLPRLAAEHRASAGNLVEQNFKLAIFIGFITISTGFTAIGGVAVEQLYGDAYLHDFAILSLIGCTQAVRFMRTWPSGLALASGHTGTVLSANILRFAALPLGLIGLLVDRGLFGLVVGLITGELISLMAAVILFNRAASRPQSADLKMVACATLVSIALPVCLWGFGQTSLSAFATGIGIGLLLLFAILFKFGGSALLDLVSRDKCRRR